MILISQDGINGVFDFPYEKCIVYIYNDMKTIKIQPVGEENSQFIVAKYSTEEKALKVMKMLRNAYVGMPVIMQNVEIADEVIEKLKKQNVVYAKFPEEKSSIEYLNNAIFQFPKDEEVEV